MERQTEHALNKELYLCGRVQSSGVYISLHGSHAALARTPDATSLLPNHARLSFSPHVNKLQELFRLCSERLVAEKRKQMLERRRGRSVAIQEKHLIYIRRGFEYLRLQRRCCTNILFVRTVRQPRGEETLKGKPHPIPTTLLTPPGSLQHSPLVVVLVGSNKEEWITFSSVLLPFHDGDLSSPRL